MRMRKMPGHAEYGKKRKLKSNEKQRRTCYNAFSCTVRNSGGIKMDTGVVIALAAFAVMALVAVFAGIVTTVVTAASLHSTNDEDSEA